MNRTTAYLLVLAPLLFACDDAVTTTTDVDGKCPVTCDDTDPCTDDRCDVTTGACVHVPRDVQNACRQDNHCDDGDPCTADSCAFDVEGQCPELQRCSHQLLPSCRSCPSFPGQCDDGSVCTIDSCGADLICRYTSEEFCDPRCNNWSYSVPSQTSIGRASVRGVPHPINGASCASGCECTKDMVLVDFDFSGQLRVAGFEAPPTCDVTSCTNGFTCQPLEAKRAYLVYGQASNPQTPRAIPARADAGGAQRPEDVSEPPQFATQLDVEGYCMFLDQSGIDGQYDATLVLDGEDQALTFEVTFTGMAPTFSGSARVTSSGWSYTEDGASLRHDFWLDDRSLNARLFPGTDRLQGPVYDPSQRETEEAKMPPEDPDVPEPPPPEKGKQIGVLTLVLRGP